MTRRLVAVVATGDTAPLALAMLEDVVDLVAAMREVEPVLAVPPRADPAVSAVTWQGMPVVTVEPGLGAVGVLDALAQLGADEGTLVAADVPDLPALLLGKLHSALTAAAAAACPADGGGLVALAARLPLAAWLRDADPRLDDLRAPAALRLTAPAGTFVVGPGWHRMRTADDLARLDPGLEGWEATRALLDR